MLGAVPFLALRELPETRMSRAIFFHPPNMRLTQNTISFGNCARDRKWLLPNKTIAIFGQCDSRALYQLYSYIF